jgi:hypothetical protein
LVSADDVGPRRLQEGAGHGSHIRKYYLACKLVEEQRKAHEAAKAAAAER